MRKYSLLGLIFILLVGLIYNTSAMATKDITTDMLGEEELLLEAIEAGGFKVEEFNINKSVFIPDIFLTMEELEKKQRDIMDALNIKGEIIYINIDDILNSGHLDLFEDPLDLQSETILVQRVEDTEYNEIIMFVPNENGNVTMIKLLSSVIMGKYETYIIVDIVENKRYKEIVEISNGVENILEEYGEKIETTINITGTHLGKLTKTEEKQSQEAIFSFLQAKKIEVLEDKLFTSITAYSPLISSFINYGNNKVNLQLAMRYSEYEDKTYLWIANPLITTTY